jgi:hypothetical protein
MSLANTHFQPDNRHILIVEQAADMPEAEREADRFLKEVSDADEGGSFFCRIKASGMVREGHYYFQVVALAEPDESNL